MDEDLQPADRAALTVELLRLTEELNWAVKLAGSTAPKPELVPEPLSYLLTLRPTLPSDRSVDVLRRYVRLFADEIALVRQTRNEVVHSVSVSDPLPVAEAVEVARELVRILRANAEDKVDVPASAAS